MVDRKPSVLIVDDEQVVCDLLDSELGERGYLCTTALSGNDAMAKLETGDFDVVLFDIRLPGMSGMEVLREIWLHHPDTATIMITAVNDVNTAVEAMKLGASDYFVKPFNLDRVDTSISAALKNKPPVKTSAEMHAIARGVEARIDPLSSFSKRVTQRTIDIARRLGINEKEIQRWVVERTRLDMEKGTVINTRPSKTK